MQPRTSTRRACAATVTGLLLLAGTVAPAVAAEAEPPEAPVAERQPVALPTVVGPIPGTAPGDPAAEQVEDTYPFFSTDVDLAKAGYVEEEFFVSGTADAYDRTGAVVGTDVSYQTRIVVRRPEHRWRSNGTVLMEWQNVTAGYDLDALWSADHIMREGYTWVGVSAQRVGVDQLRTWSPTRYGDLDVTGGGQFAADELSYDIFSQAAQAIRSAEDPDPMGRLRVKTVLAVGASQSAGRMTVLYDAVLPKLESAFDGYGFIVGSAPTRVGEEPVFQVLSETDVRTPVRPADTDQFRRWEVAGTAHSGYEGQRVRAGIAERDLGAPTEYTCDQPPFSRVPMHHVTAAAYDHLTKWARYGIAPPTAPPLEFNDDGTKARDELGIAKGGIRLSQVEVPTARNTGDNSGESFCRLFGSHEPFGDEQLAELYPSEARYVVSVVKVDHRNVRAGYLNRADAWENKIEAVRSDVGGPAEPTPPAGS